MSASLISPHAVAYMKAVDAAEAQCARDISHAQAARDDALREADRAFRQAEGLPQQPRRRPGRRAGGAR